MDATINQVKAAPACIFIYCWNTKQLKCSEEFAVHSVLQNLDFVGFSMHLLCI